MLNRVMLIGHLGRDPEIRRTNSGNPVASLRLATSETWKDKATGERKERTEWHSVVVFNDGLARLMEQYAHKGSKLYVEGELRTRKYQAQDGSDRYTTEVVLGQYGGNIRLLDKAERAAPDADDYGTTRTREGSSGPRQSGGAGASGKPNYDLDDDIPF